jgi:lipoate-protein ligase A
LFVALTDDGYLKKLTAKTVKSEKMLKIVRSCMTNLFAEYNVPVVPHKSKSSKKSSMSNDISKSKITRPSLSASSESKVKRVKKEKTVNDKEPKVKKIKSIKKETKNKIKPSSKQATVAELRALAASCGIVGRSKMVKDELIKALKKC